jgi:hypothetical protein
MALPAEKIKCWIFRRIHPRSFFREKLREPQTSGRSQMGPTVMSTIALATLGEAAETALTLEKSGWPLGRLSW